MKRAPHGFTLIELIVVLAILGLIAGISGLALASLSVPGESMRTAALRRARAQSIESGIPVSTDRYGAPHTAHVLFLPDGRALGPGADPLTGAPRE